jgi:hypothetical protein
LLIFAEVKLRQGHEIHPDISHRIRAG